MIKQNFMKGSVFIYFLTILTLNCYAQKAVNQFDSNGDRHGEWKKNFDNTKELRYEGEFKHGKEIGVFKFYKLIRAKSLLSATKTFNESNSVAQVRFLSSKGKLISEGQMDGKLYMGKWTYYHNKNDAIMSTEMYNDAGQLIGEKLVYYPDGTKAELANYNMGKLNGTSTWYTKKGNVLKVFNYKDGELHGLSTYYDTEGKLLAEGHYQNGRKNGIWKYYEKGKLQETKDHTRRSKNPNKV